MRIDDKVIPTQSAHDLIYYERIALMPDSPSNLLLVVYGGAVYFLAVLVRAGCGYGAAFTVGR